MKIFRGASADSLWRNAVRDLLDTDSLDVMRQRVGGEWTREILHACLQLEEPRQRWIVSRTPALNPAFALAEVLWILAGRNDAAFLDFWNKSYRRFAGSKENYHGAYGYRLRRQFGLDQIDQAYSALRHSPDLRQIVLQVWDSRLDLPFGDGSPRDRDIPCSVCALVKLRQGRLEWFQIMRSNDVFLGLPYDIVQWTILQEVLAGWLQADLGTYCHLSDSLHFYERDLNVVKVADIQAEVNGDSLALPKQEFEQLLGILVKCAERLAGDGLLSRHLKKLSNDIGNNSAFKNMFYIMAAEAARRRRWLDEAREMGSLCSNLLLRQAWVRWAERFT